MSDPALEGTSLLVDDSDYVVSSLKPSPSRTASLVPLTQVDLESDIDLEALESEVKAEMKRNKNNTRKKPSTLIEKVSPEILKMACDEFNGRLMREAFSICKINSKELNNVLIEVTVDDIGKLINYSHNLNIFSEKKYCLGGYIANNPMKFKGTSFTCKTFIN